MSITELIDRIKTNIFQPAIQFLFVLATVIFIWGVVQYVIAGGSQDKTQAAKNVMLWGIIGLTIMSSAWGIVKIFAQFFGTCSTVFSSC